MNSLNDHYDYGEIYSMASLKHKSSHNDRAVNQN